jgi:hypothetical protein
MATVYKVELEMVDDWVNHPPEEIEKFLKGLNFSIIYDEETNTPVGNIKVTEVKAERIA